jgi:hypothetical protein
MGEAIAGSYNFGGGYIGKHFSYGDICRRLGITEPKEKHKKKGKFGYRHICIKCRFWFHSENFDDDICDYCEKGISRDNEGKAETDRRKEYKARRKKEHLAYMKKYNKKHSEENKVKMKAERKAGLR